MHHHQASHLACNGFITITTLAKYHFHGITKIWAMANMHIKLATKTCMKLLTQPHTYLNLDANLAKSPSRSLLNQAWSKNPLSSPYDFRPKRMRKDEHNKIFFFPLSQLTARGGDYHTHTHFFSFFYHPYTFVYYFTLMHQQNMFHDMFSPSSLVMAGHHL